MSEVSGVVESTHTKRINIVIRYLAHSFKLKSKCAHSGFVCSSCTLGLGWMGERSVKQYKTPESLLKLC